MPPPPLCQIEKESRDQIHEKRRATETTDQKIIPEEKRSGRSWREECADFWRAGDDGKCKCKWIRDMFTGSAAETGLLFMAKRRRHPVECV